MFLTTRRTDHDGQPVPVARTLARPAKQLMVVRKRTQPAAVYIARLTATATFAYLIALLVPDGTTRPVLAPLTALLVLQASLFQTIRSALRKVVSVTAGVLVAVTVSAFVGFSWWLLALVIGGALTLGYLLRLGDDLLEVPISAMLIFASASGEQAAASGRIVDTLVGSAAGLIGGLAFAPLRVQSAREAVGELANSLAGQLDRMAADLAAIPAGEAPDPAHVAEWLDQTRALRGEIENVDDTLRRAEDSSRLNPRTLRTPGALPAAEVALRGGLETLEHAAVTLRGLTRSMLDSSRTATDASPVRDQQTRDRLARVLTQLGEAIRAYSRLVRTLPSDPEPLESELTTALEDAHRQQDLLADILEPRTAPEGGASEWPMRGEILAHIDRLRTGLQVDLGEIAIPPGRRRQQGKMRALLPPGFRFPRRQVPRRQVPRRPPVPRHPQVAEQPRDPAQPQGPEEPQVLNEIDPRDITPTR